MQNVIPKIKRHFIEGLKFWTIQTILSVIITVLFIAIIGMAGIDIPNFFEIVLACMVFYLVIVFANLIASVIITIINNKRK